MSRRGGLRKYEHNYRSAKPSFHSRSVKRFDHSTIRGGEATSQDEKFQAIRIANNIDESMGFSRYESGKKRIGWLYNMHSTIIEDEKHPGGRAGVDYYFLEDEGGSFKATIEYDPYFLVAVRKGKEAEVEDWCRRKFEGIVKALGRVEKEDLQMPNHLLGYRRIYLRLAFENVGDLLAARKILLPIAEMNGKKMSAMDSYAEVARYVVCGHDCPFD